MKRHDSLDPLRAWHDAASESLPGLSVMAYDTELSIVSCQGEPPLSAEVSPSEAMGLKLSDALPAQIWSQIETGLRESLTGGTSSYEMPLSNGSCLHWVKIAPLRRDGVVIGGVMSAQEVADRLIAEQELLDLTESFETAFSKAPIGMAMIALDGSLIRVNPAFNRITGYLPVECDRIRIQDMIPTEDHEQDLLMTTRLMRGEIESIVSERRLIGKAGRELWVMIATSVARDEHGAPVHLISQIQDVGDRKELERQLRRVAGEDYLTGLANRRRLEETLGTQIERCRRYDETAAVLMLDLDDFKNVNDTHGHSTGDDLLVFVADQLQARFRVNDLVARLGGDEFAVVAVESDDDRARALATELTANFDKVRFEPEGRNLPCRASVGSAVIDSESASTDEILTQADRSMYKAKIARRSPRRLPTV